MKKSFYQISGPVLKLVRTLIEKFTLSYGKVFTENGSIEEKMRENSFSIFANMKILTISALNNPELISELLTFEGPLTTEQNSTTLIQKKMTVYEIMLHSLEIGTCIFIELYLLLIRTNSGFIVPESSKEPVVCYNQAIEISVRTFLANELKKDIDQDSSKKNPTKIENILNALILTTEIYKN